MWIFDLAERSKIYIELVFVFETCISNNNIANIIIHTKNSKFTDK